MDKEKQLRSLNGKKIAFLIIGIVFMCLYVIPLIISMIHGFKFGYELVEQGYSVQYILTHIFDIMVLFFEGSLWLLILDTLFGIIFDVGIVFVILSLALFGRKARNLKREIEQEKAGE